MYLPPNNGGDFVSAPSGTHLAICYRVIDLGTQQEDFKGQVKLRRKVLISWELSDEMMEDGKPFTISHKYTFSSTENATMRLHLESWRGRKFTEQELSGGQGGFSIEKIIGVACLLNIVHNAKNGKVYANIGSVSSLPKGMRGGQPVNDFVFFTLDKFNQKVFDALSDGLKAQILKSPEYQEVMQPRGGAGIPSRDPRESGGWPNDLDDSIPF